MNSITRVFSLSSAALILVAAASAQTKTMGTFADPSPGGEKPVFTVTTTGPGLTGTMTGGWSGSGLTLQTPGFIGGGSSANATFTMSALNINATGIASAAGGGRAFIQFSAPDAANLFRVEFDTATLNPYALGGSTLYGDNVTFSGSKVPTGLSQQRFAFSLANEVTKGNTSTYTASFTSSAAVPEPASIAVLGLGALGVLRRRSNRR